MRCFKPGKKGEEGIPTLVKTQLDKYGHQWHKEIVAKQLLIRVTR